MKNKSLILIIIIFINTFNVFSQINIGGIPKSFLYQKSNLISKNVPLIKIKSFNLDSLKQEDLKNNMRKDLPFRFGHNLKVNINTLNSGIWEILPSGDKIWRLSIVSPNAKTINLLFDKYFLPENAILYIYNKDKSQILGGYTNYNNQKDSVFATTLIQGDCITIEYYEPFNVKFNGILNLSQITHGYKSFDFESKSFGNAGSCNMNVACPEAIGWENEIRSVCKFITGGNSLCTGTLVNNTAEDGTPYILTAEHCYSDPSSWVFWFNWESSTCENPITEPSYNTISGAVLRAKNTDSDFCLVELNQNIPSSFNAFFAGWDYSGTTPSSAVCIHHPEGDIKKISFDDDMLFSDYYAISEGLPNSHWKVKWDKNTVTEPGSSGSPLFDENHLVVGQLHGGFSSCELPLEPDWYGKFSMSWSSQTELRNLLNPSGLNIQYFEGLDPNQATYDFDIQIYKIINPTKFYCGSQNIKPTVVIKNRGMFEINSFKIILEIDSIKISEKEINVKLLRNDIYKVEFENIIPAEGNHLITFKVIIPEENHEINLANNSISQNYKVYPEVITTFPVNYGEISELLPCWITENNSWTIERKGSTYNPHSGDYYLLYKNQIDKTPSKIILSPFNLSANSRAVLCFWRFQSKTSESDNLKIYYKTDENQKWILLKEYSTYTVNWTFEKIELPEINSKYYIAFEGKTLDLNGIGIDDIEITPIAGTNLKVNIFPNPNKGNFKFESLSPNEVEVKIFDLYGNLVFYKIYENSKLIDIQSNIKTYGLYILRIKTGDKIHFEKLIINN